MSSSGRAGDVLQQVNQLWSMLDDLSDNEPAAYRDFLDKQLKEGAEFSAAPRLHSCLCTDILEPKKGSLYINICSWKRVPAPQDASMPLPVYAGRLETDTEDGQGSFTVLDVALNPATLQESQTDKVHTLALSFAQRQHHMRLSQHYTVVGCSPKGSPEDLNRRLGFRTWPNTSRQADSAGQSPAALLQQLCSLRSEEPPTLCRPEEHTKGLIQVVSSTSVQPRKPEHRLEMKTGGVGVAGSVELTVELPEVGSMSECQLRISQDDVLLEVEDVYHLLLEFPKTVIEDTASATFNKKKRRLTLRADVVP